MSVIKRRFNLFALLFLTLFLLMVSLTGSVRQAHSASAAQQPADYAPMPEPGKKVPLAGGSYMIYGFDKKPKLGTLIMKVQVFTADGRKDTSCIVKADAGMPSMKGAHETGDRTFSLSRKGDFLLPISIVMPGDWEIRAKVIRSNQVIFQGRYNFDI